jgi:hypothetical protein
MDLQHLKKALLRSFAFKATNHGLLPAKEIVKLAEDNTGW